MEAVASEVIMDKRTFEREVARLIRRLQLLKAEAKGEHVFRKVWVRGYSVRAYKVRGHYKHIAKGRAK